ncbi:LysR family transcriptional regulator [Comamonadaceae bacterium OTU4NAUVB1]|nr:LysR family transcriptional regulator [Comamonadaceae bacterium OTU4NAUVB1]
MYDLKRLHLLQELCALGSITKVADVVGLTRPAVSQQLSLLEKEVGCNLFERSGRGIVLTSAGKQLAARLPELFGLLEDIEAQTASASASVSGELKVCGFGSSLAALVPPAVATLRRQYPLLEVHVSELESLDGLRAAAAKQVHVAIVDDRVNLDALASMIELRALCHDPFVAVLPKAHPCAGKKSIRLVELASDGWALNQASASFHSMVMQACQKQGFTPQVRASCRNMMATLSFVRTAGLVAVLPLFGAQAMRRDSDLAIVPLRPALSRGVSAAVARGSSNRPNVAALISALRAAVALSRGGWPSALPIQAAAVQGAPVGQSNLVSEQPGLRRSRDGA